MPTSKENQLEKIKRISTKSSVKTKTNDNPNSKSNIIITNDTNNKFKETLFYNLISKNTNPKYKITIDDYKITVFENNNKIEYDNLIIDDLLYSLYKYTFNNSIHLYKKSSEACRNVLYVYLIPFLTSGNEYIKDRLYK